MPLATVTLTPQVSTYDRAKTTGGSSILPTWERRGLLFGQAILPGPPARALSIKRDAWRHACSSVRFQVWADETAPCPVERCLSWVFLGTRVRGATGWFVRGLGFLFARAWDLEARETDRGRDMMGELMGRTTGVHFIRYHLVSRLTGWLARPG